MRRDSECRLRGRGSRKQENGVICQKASSFACGKTKTSREEGDYGYGWGWRCVGVFSDATVPWRRGARKEEKYGICRKDSSFARGWAKTSREGGDTDTGVGAGEGASGWDGSRPGYAGSYRSRMPAPTVPSMPITPDAAAGDTVPGITAARSDP